MYGFFAVSGYARHVHKQLEPWCPWCHRDDGDDHFHPGAGHPAERAGRPVTGRRYSPGRCPECGKASYRTRTAAKQRRAVLGPYGRDLHVYKCGPAFHLGHLPPDIIAGKVTRTQVYRTEVADLTFTCILCGREGRWHFLWDPAHGHYCASYWRCRTRATAAGRTAPFPDWRGRPTGSES